MAQFRATIQGQRGQASRLGSKTSGITVRVNGWTAGVEVRARHDDDDGDRFEVTMTHGSSGRSRTFYLGEVLDGDDGPHWQVLGADHERDL